MPFESNPIVVPPGSKHIKIALLHGDQLQVKLAPTVLAIVGHMAWVFCTAALLTALEKRSGSPKFWQNLLLMTVMASPYLWIRLRFQILTLDQSNLSIRRGGFAETFALGAITDVRYEVKATRIERFTIAIQHTWQTVRFGKDLTASEAKWLVEFLKSRIAAAQLNQQTVTS